MRFTNSEQNFYFNNPKDAPNIPGRKAGDFRKAGTGVLHTPSNSLNAKRSTGITKQETHYKRIIPGGVSPIEKEKSITVSLRLPGKLHEELTFKAHQENTDFSKYCRRLLEKGTSVEAYKEDIDFITKIIRNELENVIEPFGNRQIKMLMKIGKATGGTLFTNIKLLLSLINPDKLYTFKELLESAMKQGVEYMKMKDFEVDQYLLDGEKMIKRSDRL